MQLHHWMRTCMLNLCLLHITSYIKNIKQANIGIEIQKPLYNLLVPKKGNNNNGKEINNAGYFRLDDMDFDNNSNGNDTTNYVRLFYQLELLQKLNSPCYSNIQKIQLLEQYEEISGKIDFIDGLFRKNLMDEW